MHKMCYLYLHILCSTAISRSFMSCGLEDILIFCRIFVLAGRM